METRSIIKFEGLNDVFVWKHPEESITSQSLLIVNNNQEVILCKNGGILDSITTGDYILDKTTAPLLYNTMSQISIKRKSIKCDIYFVNKNTMMNLRWGTDSPIQVEDPTYKIILDVRANGFMELKVSDTKRFIENISCHCYREITRDMLQDYFRRIIMVKIKSMISQIFVENKIGFLDVAARLFDISQVFKSEFAYDFRFYGLELLKFSIESINCPNSDYAKLKEAKQNAAGKRIDADAEGYTHIVLGYTPKDIMTLEIAKESIGKGGTVIIDNTVKIDNVSDGAQIITGDNTGNLIGSDSITNRPNIGISSKIAVCPYCGTKITEGLEYCNNCKHKLNRKVNSNGYNNY